MIGTLRVGEQVWPIDKISLEHGKLIIQATIVGPTFVEADRIIVYGSDGEQIIRSGGRPRWSDRHIPEGVRWTLHYAVAVVDKAAVESEDGWIR